MKKIIILLMVVFFGFSTVLCAKSQKNFQKPFEGWEKLDPKTQNIWINDSKKTDYDLDIILKTTKDIKSREKKAFRKVGFVFQTIINNIATGKIALSKLPDLAGLDFMVVIEAAVPVSLKK